MLRWTLATVSTMFLFGQIDGSSPQTEPPESQPTTQPASSSGALRKPAQADVLTNLLRRQERPQPILPQPSSAPASRTAEGTTATTDSAGNPLLPDGSIVSERPGRLVHEEGRPWFVFHVDGADSATRMMEICPNQLLETLEREAENGFTEFIVSGEVTRYRGRNYLLLRKVLRRVGHGNLGP